MKYFFFSVVMLAGVMSCTDLDEKKYDLITAEDTELTADDLSSIIGPAFTRLQAVYWQWNGMFDAYEESSDLIVTPFRVGIGWGDLYLDMHKHTWGPFIDHANQLWVRSYNGITYCNKAMLMIENLGQVENKENVLYELRALRAIYYYILLDNFRNVPIVVQFDLPQGFLPEQSTGQQVYDFIESELKEAMPFLKNPQTAAEKAEAYGRVTKWAAKMTLAKMYLNSEVYLGEEKWDEALAEVEDIITQGGFSLTPAYADNFKMVNQSSPEQIFSIPFDFTNAPGSYYPFKGLYGLSQATFEMTGGPWGGSCGIPQFIDTYDVDDSRLKESWLGGPQFKKDGTPIMDGAEQFEYPNYMTSVDAAEYNEGFRFVKYEIAPEDDGKSNDVPFYRYTDALMIKAECLLRKGDAAGAATIVTQIRQRAFKNNPSKATVTGADLEKNSVYKYGVYEAGVVTDLDTEEIEFGGFLDELAWEFVGEHHRKQDLIRFKVKGTGKSVYTSMRWLTHTPNGDYRTIFPIPQPQRETNANLQQNPGY